MKKKIDIKSVRLGVRISPATREALNRRIEQRGLTISKYVQLLIEKDLAQN